METKKCSKCGEVKSVEEFNKGKFYKDGFYYKCKSCEKEYNKEYNAKNKLSTNKNLLQKINDLEKENEKLLAQLKIAQREVKVNSLSTKTILDIVNKHAGYDITEVKGKSFSIIIPRYTFIALADKQGYDARTISERIKVINRTTVYNVLRKFKMFYNVNLEMRVFFDKVVEDINKC